MLFYINNKTFDNDDNPYGKFIFHQYTNMDGPEDIYGKRKGFNDIEIPLSKCQSGDFDWRSNEINYYCPDFSEKHFLKGGFEADKYSWMRLIVHICDNSTEAQAQREIENKKFKECASRDESIWFFENIVTGLETYSMEASIDQEFSKNLYDEKKGELSNSEK